MSFTLEIVLSLLFLYFQMVKIEVKSKTNT